MGGPVLASDPRSDRSSSARRSTAAACHTAEPSPSRPCRTQQFRLLTTEQSDSGLREEDRGACRPRVPKRIPQPGRRKHRQIPCPSDAPHKLTPAFDGMIRGEIASTSTAAGKPVGRSHSGSAATYDMSMPPAGTSRLRIGRASPRTCDGNLRPRPPAPRGEGPFPRGFPAHL